MKTKERVPEESQEQKVRAIEKAVEKKMKKVEEAVDNQADEVKDLIEKFKSEMSDLLTEIIEEISGEFQEEKVFIKQLVTDGFSEIFSNPFLHTRELSYAQTLQYDLIL